MITFEVVAGFVIGMFLVVIIQMFGEMLHDDRRIRQHVKVAARVRADRIRREADALFNRDATKK